MTERVASGRFDTRLAAAIGGTVGAIVYGLSGGIAVFDLSQGTATVDLLFHVVAGALLFAAGAALRNRLRQ
jgi:hypothetical protein